MSLLITVCGPVTIIKALSGSLEHYFGDGQDSILCLSWRIQDNLHDYK
jgi:hypothetical protein